MPGKDKFKAIIKATPSAVSIRSDSVSVSTYLFDESNLGGLNQLGFDITPVLQSDGPLQHYDRLSEWAGDGRWMAIESLPSILDGDGVPALDVVVLNPNDLELLRSAKTQGPLVDAWFDPMAQYLDLPTGKLMVVYEDDFFSSDFDQSERRKVIESAEDELVKRGDWSEFSSYTISCKPGFYQAHVFTRFEDEMSEYEPDEGSPDVVVYLEPAEKPTSFSKSCPLIPSHPTTQDMEAVKQKATEVARDKGWDVE
ncbi:MAG: hypothetical protein AB8G99_10265 [Planctomycetaceae bacterium]